MRAIFQKRCYRHQLNNLTLVNIHICKYKTKLFDFIGYNKSFNIHEQYRYRSINGLLKLNRPVSLLTFSFSEQKMINASIAKSDKHKPRPMIDLLVSIVAPSLILMKFSGDDALGASGALITALAFPLGWGLFELFKYKKFNWISLLGLISVILTGGIGLLQLDPKWLAIKEAAIPGLLGLAVLISTFTRYPLIKTMLFNPAIINVEKIQQQLEERGYSVAFDNHLSKVTYLLSGTFFFSSLMNFILAKLLVTSPAGSVNFNEELARLTLLSYPVIVIPSMLMLMGVFYYLWRTIHDMTGLSLESILVSQKTNNQD